jgi:hypothetical protein
MLRDRLQVAGRQPGLMGTWRGGGSYAPRVYLGVFQGRGADDQLQGDSLKSAVRASLELGRAEVGAFFEHRDGEPVDGLGIERFWCAGADLTVSTQGLRAWIDLFVGSSWIDSIPQDDEEPRFVMGRAIVAYRLGGEKAGQFYVEPFVSGGALDPDLDIRKDLIGEFGGGVNVGAWRRGRLQVELEWHEVQKNTPIFFAATDRIAFVTQIGAAF